MEREYPDRYEERLEALFLRFPSVSTAGFSAAAYKPGLAHMVAFDARLGHPASRLRTVHVAGTNGKGSVSSMLASALAAGGARVGLFTSPHLLDFRERIKIVSDEGFRLIPREEVLAFLDRWDETFEALSLSFFEISTGLALDWLAREGVDCAVIEVGLGGRLDSTNILTPELSVVTSIGLDHCAQLGGTRAAIAGEKAGIFKPGVPALVGAWDPETGPVFEAAAAAAPCPLFFADELNFEGQSWLRAGAASGLPDLDLRGAYQAMNLRTTLAALSLLGVAPDSDALAHTASRTGLRGRWETLCTRPLTLCDIGHNPPALQENFAQLQQMMRSGRFHRLYILYGVMADKALDDILPLMPPEAHYCFVTPDTPRARPWEDIAARWRSFRPEAQAPIPGGSVGEGIARVRALAHSDDLIYIGGSTFVVAEALRFYEALPPTQSESV